MALLIEGDVGVSRSMKALLTPGGSITLYLPPLLRLSQVTSSKWRFILITVPPIFIDRLLRFIEHSMCTYHSPITLIIWLITPNLVIPWLSTLEPNKGVVYVRAGLEGEGKLAPPFPRNTFSNIWLSDSFGRCTKLIRRHFWFQPHVDL